MTTGLVWMQGRRKLSTGAFPTWQNQTRTKVTTAPRLYIHNRLSLLPKRRLDSAPLLPRQDDSQDRANFKLSYPPTASASCWNLQHFRRRHLALAPETRHLAPSGNWTSDEDLHWDLVEGQAGCWQALPLHSKYLGSKSCLAHILGCNHGPNGTLQTETNKTNQIQKATTQAVSGNSDIMPLLDVFSNHSPQWHVKVGWRILQFVRRNAGCWPLFCWVVWPSGNRSRSDNHRSIKIKQYYY